MLEHFCELGHAVDALFVGEQRPQNQRLLMRLHKLRCRHQLCIRIRNVQTPLMVNNCQQVVVLGNSDIAQDAEDGRGGSNQYQITWLHNRLDNLFCLHLLLQCHFILKSAARHRQDALGCQRLRDKIRHRLYIAL